MLQLGVIELSIFGYGGSVAVVAVMAVIWIVVEGLTLSASICQAQSGQFFFALVCGTSFLWLASGVEYKSSCCACSPSCLIVM